ncbi:MAG: TrmH family RNA methyltransferase, partial [Candidatus Paceibacterota bacterium]
MRKLILHNIRSAHNVGSIFRTAEGAGVRKIYLSGYTPAPIDRFGRKRKDLAKVALGAEDMIEWEKSDDIQTLISNLKKDGRVIAVEQSPDSVDYTVFSEPESVTYIFGNEVEGIEE